MRPCLAALCGLLLLTACGQAATAAVVVAPASPPTLPAATPSPAVSATPTTFAGSVDSDPGTLVRFGPGMDMPGMDVEPSGRSEVFDGWFERTDDPPQPDAVTGHIEAWSRDWFHLADGRGWVSSASVRGLQPAGMPQSSWTRPASLPEPAAALLGVPLHHQEQRATCEVAALEMALAGRGIVTGEEALLALTTVDDEPPVLDHAGNVLRWGDPNQAFVGNPNGDPPDHTGYGVYAAPIARAATGSGAGVLASGTGIAPATLYADLMGGHPAVAWVSNTYRAEPLEAWTAWNGAQVHYSLTEHAVTVVGVTPTMVLLNDPWYGRKWHTRADFEAAYSTFGDMAVVLA